VRSFRPWDHIARLGVGRDPGNEAPSHFAETAAHSSRSSTRLDCHTLGFLAYAPQNRDTPLARGEKSTM
jgi:hypothetical protein